MKTGRLVITRDGQPKQPQQFPVDTRSADDGDTHDISSFRATAPQVLAVMVKNVLLLGYGMTLGFPTILIPAIQGGDGRDSTLDSALHLTKDQISWLSSINLICVPLGCIFSGSLTQPLGRRRAMQFVNIPMFTAWLCFHFSRNVSYLYAGLCLAGISGGLLEAPVLTYVSEVTTPRVRGMLAASGSFSSILGVFMQFVLGTFLKWRTIALISLFVPVLAFGLLFLVPESPHWLIQKHRYDEAKAALAWLRGWVPISQIEQEYQLIYESIRKTENSTKPGGLSKFKPYTKSSFFKPYLIISSCFFIGHFSGMTTLQTYAVQIFHTLKAPIDKYYATMLLGVSELIGIMICIILVHYTGKRPLVIASAIGCGLCFFGTATYAHYLNLVPGEIVHNIVANKSAIASKPLRDIINLNDTLLGSKIAENLIELQMSLKFHNETDELMESATDSDYGQMFLFKDTFEMSYSVGGMENETDYELQANETDDAVMEETMGGNKKVPENFIIPVVKHAENKYLWIPLTFLLGSAVLSHAGIRLIPWMLIGELYSTEVRGGASGFSGGTGYLFGFCSNKIFLTLISGLTLPGTFWLYSSVSFLGAVLIYFILPETEGRTLLEIEEHFAGGLKLHEKPKTDELQHWGNGRFSQIEGPFHELQDQQSQIRQQQPQYQIPVITVSETNFQYLSDDGDEEEGCNGGGHRDEEEGIVKRVVHGHNGPEATQSDINITEANQSQSDNKGKTLELFERSSSIRSSTSSSPGHSRGRRRGLANGEQPHSSPEDSRIQMDFHKSETIFEKKLQERGGEEWLKKVKEIPKETQLAVALGMKRAKRPTPHH